MRNDEDTPNKLLLYFWCGVSFSFVRQMPSITELAHIDSYILCLGFVPLFYGLFAGHHTFCHSRAHSPALSPPSIFLYSFEYLSCGKCLTNNYFVPKNFYLKLDFVILHTYTNASFTLVINSSCSIISFIFALVPIFSPKAKKVFPVRVITPLSSASCSRSLTGLNPFP